MVGYKASAMHGIRPLLGAVLIVAVAARLAAQNTPAPSGPYPSAQIQAGAALYAGQCSACHGANGDQIPNVNFRLGQFPTVVSDADLARVVAGGKPAAGMPAFAILRTDEIAALTAFIRSGFDASASGVTIGNAARGAAVFTGKGTCTTCHRVNGRGSYAASDLSDIGLARKPESLQRALIDPA